jgi:DNA invertase Pin-like site-specific DNA recombinase
MTTRGDWLAWVLAGALGGLIVLVSTMAVGVAYRRRDRPLVTGSLRRSKLAATIPAARGKPALDERAMPLVDETATATPLPGAGVTSARSSSHLAPGSAVIGYVKVPPDSGVSDESEALTAIEATCARAGWKLLEIVRDREDSRALDRPGLGYALGRIADGQAQGLVVRDLERLSRSIIDLGVLMAWFRDAQAILIALDPDVDTSTPEGQRVATTLIALSVREHERIASATRRGLAEGRAHGRRVGRPAVSDRPELVARIAAMRAANMTLRAIADRLNAEGVPTPRGGKKWRPSSIQAALGYRRPDPRDHLPAPRGRARP